MNIFTCVMTSYHHGYSTSCACVCVCVFVCVFARERERERELMCVYSYVCRCVWMVTCIQLKIISCGHI